MMELEKAKVTQAFLSPACPGFLRGQVRLFLPGFRTTEAVKRKVKQINNMERLGPWTLQENHFEKYLQGIWFVFPFRTESNWDGEESSFAAVQASSPNCVGQREHVIY